MNNVTSACPCGNDIIVCGGIDQKFRVNAFTLQYYKLCISASISATVCRNGGGYLIHHQIDQAYPIFLACLVKNMGRPGYKAIAKGINRRSVLTNHLQCLQQLEPNFMKKL